MHGIAYDPKYDEIIVPVALAGAILAFRGGAVGEEAPIRIIQGPKTEIMRPDTVYQDVKNEEIIVGDPGAESILVFRRDANGDVAPLRMLRGRKTKIDSPEGVAVDPVRNLLVVANHSYRNKTSSILIFNRTDQGNVAPRAIISGSNTGIILFRQVEVDPDRGKIFVAVMNNKDCYKPNAPDPSPWNPDQPGFIGVWDITDNGNVPPKAVIKGLATGLIWPGGVALNLKDGEVFVVDSVSNGMSMFTVPEFFENKK